MSTQATPVWQWLRASLFGTPLNTTLTLAALLLLYFALPPVLLWSFAEAVWTGSGRVDCDLGEGACWAFIGTYLNQFIYHFYPVEEQWRVNLAFVGLLILLLGFAWPRLSRLWLLVSLLGVYPIVAFGLFAGGIVGLEPVSPNDWGGLFLTLMLSIVGIAASFPLGVLLALGRRSEMPVIRALSVTYIELIRGVPLISILFMAAVMLPLFLPDGVNFSLLLRALVGIILFSSALVAEVVRGGLQALPKGQYEAADALGLGYWKTMGLIILPQSLRLVIPGLVNTFIALLKDTTLVIIIGLHDFLGRVQAATREPSWGEVSTEGYVFAAFIYWLFCFSMSRYSQRLERKLASAER